MTKETMKLVVKTPNRTIRKNFKSIGNAELHALQYLIANYECGAQPIEVTIDSQRRLLNINRNWRGLFSDGDNAKYQMVAA